MDTRREVESTVRQLWHEGVILVCWLFGLRLCANSRCDGFAAVAAAADAQAPMTGSQISFPEASRSTGQSLQPRARGALNVWFVILGGGSGSEMKPPPNGFLHSSYPTA
ncbi:hypothetical protein N658DRAFT_498110 [Parathielavia hyrcaniae]|uniref:Uncharacterized protein n=1 Tax=Parathielavia hyrcaniae TaxID=113614 RepID=A0AAN6T0D5_9PEZI|nr:hypothetical protein N658DRAFT_498110 [Parathielavia hyrcaniae]